MPAPAATATRFVAMVMAASTVRNFKLAAAMQANSAMSSSARVPRPKCLHQHTLAQRGHRRLGHALVLRCRQRITDPTSGFQMINQPALHFLPKTYPADYPEPESLALLTRQGYRVCEPPLTFARAKADAPPLANARRCSTP